MEHFTEPHFSHARPPAIEVEIIEKEVRRISARMAPPDVMRFIDERGKCRPIELFFMSADCESYRDAQIVDIGVGGFGLATALRLEVGHEADLLARDAERGSVLFEEHVEIMNERPAGKNANNGGLRTYGVRTLAEEHSTLYKCILDSVFLAHVASSGLEIDEVPFRPQAVCQ